MDEHEVNCTVCMEPFEEEHHSPRTLRCGHTLCTPCIEALLDRAHHDRLCPECRKPLKISAVGHIPISYTILRLARALSSATYELHIKVQVEDGETCLQHGAPIMSWCRECNVWRCRECKCPKECTVFMNLPEALLHIKQAYVDSTNSNISRLADQKAIYEKKKSEIEKEMLALGEKNKKIEENLKRFDASIDKLEEYEAQTVEASSSRRLDKVLGLTDTFLKDMETWLEDLKRSAESEKSSSLRVAPATRRVQTPVLRPDVPLTGPLDFVSLKERLKVCQSMYAVQEKGGRTRWAKLSINEKNLLIHALDDIPPPAGATLLPLDSIMAGMSPNKPSAFFDVTIQQRLEGNVCMTMFGVTPRSQNFLLLCSGALGPCFRGLQLKSSDIGEGKPKFSLVVLGPFPDGQDCPPLVDGITDGGSYNSDIYPGLITGCPADRSSSAFQIMLEDMVGFTCDYAFGSVTSGLAIMQSVHREVKSNFREALISDCGLVVPLA